MKIADSAHLTRSARQHRRKDGFLAGGACRALLRLQGRGVEITLASPKGGHPPIDPRSQEPGAQTPATRRIHGRRGCADGARSYNPPEGCRGHRP